MGLEALLVTQRGNSVYDYSLALGGVGRRVAAAAANTTLSRSTTFAAIFVK